MTHPEFSVFKYSNAKHVEVRLSFNGDKQTMSLCRDYPRFVLEIKMEKKPKIAAESGGGWFV